MIYRNIYAVPVLEEIEFTFIMYRVVYRELSAIVSRSARATNMRVGGYITIAVQLRSALHLYIPRIVPPCHRRHRRRRPLL